MRAVGGGEGPCFNMSPRSEGFDIPRLECMIGLEIHVTHFQRLVRELHSDHISPFFFHRGRWDLVTQGAFFFFFFFNSEGECFTCRQTDVCVCVRACMYALAFVHQCMRACVRACLCMFEPQLVLKHGRKSIVRTFS